MAIFLLVVLPALTFLGGILGLQSDPNSERRKKLMIVLVLALSAMGSVVASLYQQQSDDAAKKYLQDNLTAIQGKTDDIKTLLVNVITTNGFSPTFVQEKKQSGFAPADLQLVQQSLTAEGAVSALGSVVSAENQQQQTTVTYYAKDVDPKNVDGRVLIDSLKQYGFNVQEVTSGERNPELRTNAVWVGHNVAEKTEKWKLVTFLLMRAGLQIRAIREFQSGTDGSPRKPDVIEIGADRAVESSPPLTVQQVQAMKGLLPR